MRTIAERFYGAAQVARAKRLAVKNGWPLEIIKNANGCYGMYAQTDAILQRPETAEEQSARIRAECYQAEFAMNVERIKTIVPQRLFDSAFLNNTGKPRIAVADCEGLIVPKTRNDEPHVDVSLVLQCNYPELSSFDRKVFYDTLKRRRTR